jgi:hypothetical protein
MSAAGHHDHDTEPLDGELHPRVARIERAGRNYLVQEVPAAGGASGAISTLRARVAGFARLNLSGFSKICHFEEGEKHARIVMEAPNSESLALMQALWQARNLEGELAELLHSSHSKE